MQNRYLDVFQRARQYYLAQTPRLGYPNGWFTWFRHGLSKHPYLENLHSELSSERDDARAQEIIKTHFREHPQFHNHSFNTYFLDELLRAFPLEDWQRFHPRPIVFYRGKLYRGSQLTPDVVFKNGFIEENSSLCLDDYVQVCNGSVGVSTTKLESVARAYALPPITINKLNDPSANITGVGYVYEIDYRGCEGIDVTATNIKRNNMIVGDKQEVNIVGRILPQDIVCAWKLTQGILSIESKKIINTLYDPTRVQDEKPTSNLIVPHRDFLCR